MGWLIGPEDLHFTKSEIEDLEPEHVATELKNKADAIYQAKEAEFTSPIMREVERVVLLRNVDQEWMDHIDAMEQLQDGIRLRAYANQDPVVEYRIEGFDMFDSMIAAIRENTAKMILTVRLRKKEEAPQREQVAKETSAGAASAGDKTVQKQPVHKQKKPGRNDPCPCGSGLKYKKCCGRKRVSRQGGRDVRNGMKRAALGLAAAALCLGLMGCSLSSGFADYDVSGYFQALLDSSYKNQNENYATVAATTEENAQQNNTTTVRNAAVNFCNTYGVTPSDDQLSQLQEVMSQALAQASYTVQDEVKTETGYTLEIVIDPIVNFSDMGDDIRQLRNQAQDEATQANSSASDEEDSYGSGDSYDESSDGDSYDSYDDYGSDDYGYGGDSSEDSSTMEDQDSSLGVG